MSRDMSPTAPSTAAGEPPPPASPAAAAFATFASTAIAPAELQRLTSLQAETYRAMREANEELSGFNRHAAEQHAALASRLSGHVATLNSVRNRLLSVFQRTRALRRRLLEARPELQAAADTADAACEREREQPR